ncbi:hypothetical protein [Nocardiopsis sp. JB363]|uniref:hypothetical protein n=1 Tax=Nocardiopsis sp. JB363 TaxID=1434837 RepID=UPI00097B0972|nr:hypothetical protein [Nocardiopsis sp. JB363]SIO86008.1 hypothetical protein BQ8420_09825 [Nocardiopsis sp. JB363]
MIEEFRAAFQRVLDTAAGQAPDFSEAVQEAFRLSSSVPQQELEIAIEALAPVLGDCEPYAGVAADLSVLAGALVESGTPAGQSGLEVLRQVGSYGQAAVAFMHAWEKTGGGTLPAPSQVGDEDEKRVEEVLGDNAPLATIGWWTAQRYGLAAKAMLSDSGVRSAVRADRSALDGLSQIVEALSTRLSEFSEVTELLRMAEVSRVLVLDRASWRGFRVRFDGVSDNFQLHTLLADALIGKEGLRLPGTRPDPRWVVASLDGLVDPLADVVRGEWDLVGGDGTWVGNEGYPGGIPEVDGERVLVLEPQSLMHSWRAGRRHPNIPGALTVLAELHADEAASWWARLHPAGSVRHPQAPPIELDDTGTHRRPPRHFGVAAHFAEVDSDPLSAPFSALDPELDTPDPGLISNDLDPNFDSLFGGGSPFDDDPIGPSSTSPASPPSSAAPMSSARFEEDEADEFPVPAPWASTSPPLNDEESHTIPDPGPFRDPDPFGGARDALDSPSWGDALDSPSWSDDPGSARWGDALDSPSWNDPLDAPSWGDDPDSPRGDDTLDAPSSDDTSEETERKDDPPGARLLPPMPPGVSNAATWAPHWKWPMDPPRR